MKLACLLLLPTALAAQSGIRQATFSANDALDVTTWSAADISADGRWLAALSTTRRASLGVDYRRDGDPSYIRPGSAQLWVIDTRSGELRPVFPTPRAVREVTWSPDGRVLAMIVGGQAAESLAVWDRQSQRLRTFAPPAGHYIAENAEVRWTTSGARIVAAFRSSTWKQGVATEFARLTAGPVFVQDSKDPFLAWDELRRRGSLRSLHSIDVATGRTTALVPEGMITSWSLTSDDSLVTWQEDITRKTDYDVIFGRENRLLAQRLSGGPVAVIQPSLKGLTLTWAEDGRRYAYTRDGRVYVASIGDSVPRLVAGDTGRTTDGDTSATARALRARARFSAVRFAPRGDLLLLSNPEGFWVADVASGARNLVLATDTSASAPRHAPVAWTPDGTHLLFSVASRTQWERGLLRVSRQGGAPEVLVRDGRLYQGWRLSRDGSTLLYASGEGNRPLDLHAAGPGLESPRRLTSGSPTLAGKALARTDLVSYLDADGLTRHAVLYLPPGFQPGTKYPTLFNVYEEFFDDTFDATANVLAGAGYVVVKPSVGFETGYPGEAWLKGVTAAANALVARGIADSARLGVFGTSYGGYATNLLITQTHRFKAAVNVSGKVDIISFYTDSPRLGVRNIHAAEKSQDRLGATLWQQPQKYVAHSAVMFADRITTPLLLITGEQDSNVPAGNTREMYYALRRLGKDVTWVNYMNSGHGTPGTNAAEFIDYHERLLGFFGRHLSPAQPPRIVEATALTGEPLYRNVPSGAARDRMEAQLADARRAYHMTPANADSIIWYGRRTAYPGRFNDAIAIFSEGIERHPADARMYRHRGHRYLSTRKLDLAIADFEKAASLIRGRPDEVEPDGQPNARGIPTSTLHSNIRYHLGLAYYLKGDFARALPIYREDLRLAANPDTRVATSHWLYMTLRRLGRDAEAAQVLVPITRDMPVIENGNYHRLLLLYKGELTAQEVLRNFGTDGGLDDITTAYGVANWHLYNGRASDAEALLLKIVSAKGQWASFGYLAAEAELTRLGRATRATSR